VTGLPVCSGAAAVRALERAGFKQVSQRGSHVKLRTPPRIAPPSSRYAASWRSARSGQSSGRRA
jgi:HicA toxin of bacterial toxin-antitoxin,